MNQRYLGERSSGRDNNLNLIRLVAAFMVIFSHSYPIVQGQGGDFLSVLSKGTMDCGAFAVSVFFFYGGFLICRSAWQKSDAGVFWKARCKRIFPPLVFVTALLAFLVGPLVSTLPVAAYFQNSGTYRYMLNACFLLVHDLPGVFAGNPYNATVNGPLWTLPIEFLCYILCFLMVKTTLADKKKAKWTIVPVVAVFGMLQFLLKDAGVMSAAIRPMLLFYIGMLSYIYRDSIRIKMSWALIALLVLLISVPFGLLPWSIYLFGTYFLLWLGFGTKHTFGRFGTKYEVSYGVYLTGWPIQQILCQYCSEWMTPRINFALASIGAFVCGFFITVLTDYILQKLSSAKREVPYVSETISK